MIDELAAELGMDPLELRKQNDPHPVRQRQYELGAEAIGWSRRDQGRRGEGPAQARDRRRREVEAQRAARLLGALPDRQGRPRARGLGRPGHWDRDPDRARAQRRRRARAGRSRSRSSSGTPTTPTPRLRRLDDRASDRAGRAPGGPTPRPSSA
ncbi:MAG: hypothetical protein R3F62_20015 [Planctomycetota bacterium]